MSKCEYTIRGKVDPTHTKLFNYVANTAPSSRSSEEVYKVLREAGIAIRKQDKSGAPRMYLTMGHDSSVNYIKAQNINLGARLFFGIPQNERLLEYVNLGQKSNKFTGINTLYGLTINEEVLRKMKSVDREKIARDRATADEVASLLSGPASPFKQDYLLSEKALEENNAERSKFSKMGKAQLDTVTKQVTKLKDSFAKAGIEVEVVLDGDIEEKGMVIPPSAENPVPRILLNPNEITEDTTYHEFAHLFVDLLGYNNPLVQQAVKQLRDSTLYQEVVDFYPELVGDQERLDKEVLATAIGIQGAKMNKKNPSKIEQLINKIFRAIGKLFGVQPNAVELLAENMIVKELDSKQFLGALAPYVQKSKAEKNVEKIVNTLKVKTETAIRKLEAQPIKNEVAINELKLQQKKLESVKEIEGLISFTNYAKRLAARADKTFDNIKQNYNSDPTLVSGEERLQMMQDLHQVHTWIQAFHNNTEDGGSTLTAIKLELLEKAKSIEANGGNLAELEEFKKNLGDAIDVMDKLDRDYTTIGIPILADLLLEYNRPEINDKIDQAIENIKKTGREFGLNKKTPEYRAIRTKYREGAINAEEFKKEVIELNIEQLKSRKIGRDTIVKELQEGQKNKGFLSYMMDPLIYSSQTAIQLFGTHVKNSLYRAADKFRETKYSLRDIYREYAQGRDGLNEAKFNEPILDTYTYEIVDWEETRKKGDIVKKKIKMVSFVQPYDVGKYYEAESKAMMELSEKHKRPLNENELKTWAKSKDAINYYKDLAAWYKENSSPIEGAKEKYDELVKKRKATEASLKVAVEQGEADKAGLLEAELSSLKTQIGSVYDYKSKQFKGAFARPNDKYKSAKYQKLVSNKNSVEYRYYEALLNTYKKSQSQLGKTNQIQNNWDNFSYVLPTVRKEALDKGIEGGIASAGKDMIQDSFQILETDTDYGMLVGLNGERLQTVPVFYVNPVDEKDVSRDVIGSVLKFDHMSNMFKEKSKILGSVEMMRDVIEQRKPIEEDEHGNPAYNQIAAKFTGMAKRLVKQDTKRDPDNQLRHLSEFIDSVFYGERNLKNNFKKTINLFGKEFQVSGDKLSQAATFLTAATALAGNKLQAVNQIIIDNERLIEEGIAAEFFNAKDLAWAKGEYYKNLASLKTVKDAGAFSKDNKMLQAAELLDAFSESIDDDGSKVSGDRLKKFASMDTLFSFQNAAEHETAITRMLAVARGYKGKLKDASGKIIMNESGQPADLYDVLIKDSKGMLILDPKVANVTLLEVRNTLAGIQKKTNQLKGPVDRSMAERRSIGKLATLFRRFLAPGFRRSWGHGGLGNVSYLHIDTETGALTEGVYWTTFKYMRDQMKGLISSQPTNVWNLLTDSEKSNVKRGGTQAVAMLTALILGNLLIGAAADEDDEETAAMYTFWAYQARRLQTELGSFLNPKEAYNISKSPSAAARPLMNIYDLTTQIAFKEIPYALGADSVEKDIYYQRKSGRFDKGDRKVMAKLEKVIPLWSGINKDAEQAIKWFDLNG